jgi:hypothetical protein
MVGYALGYPLTAESGWWRGIRGRSTNHNTAAHHAYRSWGWYKIGELQPFGDAPVFDAMVLDLPK